MKINYVPDLQHTIREGPAIYTYVDSACPLFLESRYFSARKMYAYYIKLINFISISQWPGKVFSEFHIIFNFRAIRNSLISKIQII